MSLGYVFLENVMKGYKILKENLLPKYYQTHLGSRI